VRALLLVVLGFALISCGEEREAAAPASAAIGPPRDCPVTSVAEPFVPPEPYASKVPPLYESSWYGTERLWTWLRADGTLPMARDRSGYFQKSFWWAPGADGIRVTARRLDGPSPPVSIAQQGVSSRYDLGEFLLIGLELPDRGCWEITGHAGGAELSFVVRVTPG
jgi:hypothetical protein